MTYEYKCDNCGKFEVIQKITDDRLKRCPRCGGNEIKRLISSSNFILLGTGWYEK
jgi:putative FmdB family regulatory protein